MTVGLVVHCEYFEKSNLNNLKNCNNNYPRLLFDTVNSTVSPPPCSNEDDSQCPESFMSFSLITLNDSMITFFTSYLRRPPPLAHLCFQFTEARQCPLLYKTA